METPPRYIVQLHSYLIWCWHIMTTFLSPHIHLTHLEPGLFGAHGPLPRRKDADPCVTHVWAYAVQSYCCHIAHTPMHPSCFFILISFDIISHHTTSHEFTSHYINIWKPWYWLFCCKGHSKRMSCKSSGSSSYSIDSFSSIHPDGSMIIDESSSFTSSSFDDSLMDFSDSDNDSSMSTINSNNSSLGQPYLPHTFLD